jgi:hypothetical protein
VFGREWLTWEVEEEPITITLDNTTDHTPDNTEEYTEDDTEDAEGVYICDHENEHLIFPTRDT